MVLTSPWAYNFNCAPHSKQYLYRLSQSLTKDKGKGKVFLLYFVFLKAIFSLSLCAGELDRGDQIMMVEGKTFIDINRQIAQKFLDKCMESPEVRENSHVVLTICICKTMH